MKLPADKVHRLRPFYGGRTICVTGGAGFIGGHLVDTLLSLGASIRVLDDLSNSTLEHLAELIELEPERVRFIRGSVLDDEALAEAMSGASTVFHLGAMCSVQRSVEDPQRSFSVNATGTLRVLQAARKTSSLSGAGVERVVLASSSSLYGDDPSLPRVESQLPRPLSPYAAGKLAAEHLMSVHARCFGMSTISLRLFNVFGPRQTADSPYSGVVASFAKRMLAGESPVIFGDGLQTRDFTFVADAVLAFLLAGFAKVPPRGEVVNVGTGRSVTLLELARAMGQAVGAPHVHPTLQPERPADVKHSLADISRARELIGYEPTYTLEAGLAELIEWCRQSVNSGQSA
ncbi:MAG: SDR family NAD(P)-dependent oxidoreductase [Phycisphaerales bacterium]|nr:SDR family NAD(P)-dependent oxidoreductase [Planctomycetota bacterium]